ncbi:MAG: serine protease [Vulcanimicrobiota bacterium]
MVDVVVGEDATPDIDFTPLSRKRPLMEKIGNYAQVFTAIVLVIFLVLALGWQKQSEVNENSIKIQKEKIKALEGKLDSYNKAKITEQDKVKILSRFSDDLIKGGESKITALDSMAALGHLELAEQMAVRNPDSASICFFASLALYGDEKSHETANKAMAEIIGENYIPTVVELQNLTLVEENQSRYTGFFFNENAYIITTNSLLSPVDNQIKVYKNRNSKFIKLDGTIVKTNDALGVTFIKLEGLKKSEFLELAPKPMKTNEKLVYADERVIVIGTKQTSEDIRMVPIEGTITRAQVENEPDKMTLNVDFNQVFSADFKGGPVINRKGQVVGVVDRKSINEKKATLYAIRSDRILDFLKKWKISAGN